FVIEMFLFAVVDVSTALTVKVPIVSTNVMLPFVFDPLNVPTALADWPSVMSPDVVLFVTDRAAALIEPVPVSPIPVVAVSDTFPVPAVTAAFTEIVPVFVIEMFLFAVVDVSTALTVKVPIVSTNVMLPFVFDPLNVPTALADWPSVMSPD